MDVKKSKAKQSKFKTIPIIGGLAVCLLAALTWYVSINAGATTVKRNDMLFGTVKKGDLQVEIEGYGALRSDRHLLSKATLK